MTFERAATLALNTPAGALSEAWGLCPADTLSVTREKRPMTVKEAGALAELHGLKLLDVLAV